MYRLLREVAGPVVVEALGTIGVVNETGVFAAGNGWATGAKLSTAGTTSGTMLRGGASKRVFVSIVGGGGGACIGSPIGTGVLCGVSKSFSIPNV